LRAAPPVSTFRVNAPNTPFASWLITPSAVLRTSVAPPSDAKPSVWNLAVLSSARRAAMDSASTASSPLTCDVVGAGAGCADPQAASSTRGMTARKRRTRSRC
jgi:hypothetical protein